MPATNFDELIVGGVPVTGAGGVVAGNVFWVNSATGSDTNDGVYGRSKDKPFDTIAYAISICTAAAGDVIYVMPGHTETISAAAGIDASKSGISIVGLGNGTNRPLITVGTLTTATFKISADNVLVKNLRFTAGTAQLLVKMIDVSANFATLEDCHFLAASTATFLVKSFINLLTTKDDLTVRRCQFYQGTDPAGTDGGADSGAFYCVDSENILFEDCIFYGNFETAIFHNRTTACKNLWVKRCYGRQALSGAEPFQLVDGATGFATDGGFITPAETGAVEATLAGTLGDGFFIAPTCTFGNDGLAGGQGGIIVATAS